MRLVLGSLSPRRKELLGQFKIPFKIIGSHLEEPKRESGEDVNDFSLRVSRFKANEIKPKLSDGEILITSDTIVVHNELVLGKPIDRKNAFETLKQLSGNSHFVITSWILSDNKTSIFEEVTQTEVFFRDLSEVDINNYLDLNTFSDKAGSYAIQEEASHFVDKIEGSINTVVGLPLSRLSAFFTAKYGEGWRENFLDN